MVSTTNGPVQCFLANLSPPRSVAELVQDGVNGRTFRSAQDLADQLVVRADSSRDSFSRPADLSRMQTLLRAFPDRSTELHRLREGILRAKYGGDEWCTWDENWEKVVVPLLT